MTIPNWITRVEALSIHEKMLGLFGGGSGLRDQELLDSALARPQHRFAYEGSEIPELAASYAVGIVLNHPFIDGNKRTP